MPKARSQDTICRRNTTASVDVSADLDLGKTLQGKPMRSVPLQALSRSGSGMGSKPSRPYTLPELCARRRRSQMPGRHGRDFFLFALFCVIGPVLAQAKTYYLSPTGSDANSGLSSNAAWQSPNHALNCGDVIVAAASAKYSAPNFYTGRWGTVSCPTKDKVAWLQCETFDACKIHTTTNQGMWIDKSYWECKVGKLPPLRRMPMEPALSLNLITHHPPVSITLSLPTTSPTAVRRGASPWQTVGMLAWTTSQS